jgi:CubicO group peptidase (beta-lactamase class C family)
MSTEDDIATAVRDRNGLRGTGPTAPRPVFSVTKMFVATAILRLSESGDLALDDEITTPLRPATPRALLGHTAGLPDYGTTVAYRDAVAAHPSRPWTLAEITAAALTQPAPTPGAYSYSNLGYWLLGANVERATGTPLHHTLAELVFEPAGMTATFYPADGTWRTDTGYDTRWAGPAGAAWSTPADMTTFLTALFAGNLVSETSLTAMTKPTPVAPRPPWPDPGYGLGLVIDGELGTFGHSGDGPGYGSAAYIVPATGRSAAVITKSPASVADPIEAALRLLAD